jgi:hypothetical protein
MEDKELHERLVVLGDKLTVLEKQMGLIRTTIERINDDKVRTGATDKWLERKIQMSELR